MLPVVATTSIVWNIPFEAWLTPSPPATSEAR